MSYLIIPNVPLIYNLARLFCMALFHSLWRLNVIDRKRIPFEGPLIVCANHRSYFDPPLVACAMTRAVHFLAKEELFVFKPFGWLIGQMNAHPLNRSGDVGAFKMAIRILKQNGVIIVFPEGRRSQTDEFRPPKPGVGLLAKKTGARVLPLYIHNSAHWLKGKKIEVMVGHPIDPARYETYSDVGEAVMGEIKALSQNVKR